MWTAKDQESEISRSNNKLCVPTKKLVESTADFSHPSLWIWSWPCTGSFEHHIWSQTGPASSSRRTFSQFFNFPEPASSPVGGIHTFRWLWGSNMQTHAPGPDPFTLPHPSSPRDGLCRDLGGLGHLLLGCFFTDPFLILPLFSGNYSKKPSLLPWKCRVICSSSPLSTLALSSTDVWFK